MSSRPFVQRSPIPGFGLAMGVTMAMLSVVVLLPIGALSARSLPRLEQTRIPRHGRLRSAGSGCLRGVGRGCGLGRLVGG